MMQVKRYILLPLFTFFFLINVPGKSGTNSTISNSSSIILSEIMYDPSGSEHYDEFVEIYNISATNYINLTGWSIGDGEGYDQIIDAGDGLILAPGQFGLILDPGYFGNSTSYDSLLPSEALVVTIDGATFGQRGWSNSSEKTVFLLDSTGQVKNQYTYIPGNKPGFSLEKIDLYSDNSSLNWGESNVEHGTPGFKNSISLLEIDAELIDLQVEPDPAVYQQDVELQVWVKNSGRTKISNIQYLIFIDTDNDSVPQNEELVLAEQNFIVDLAGGDTLFQEFILAKLESGIHDLSVQVYTENDQNEKNNYRNVEVKIGYPAGGLVINEILYQPAAGMPEWLEVYNRSEKEVNIKEWILYEPLSENKYVVTTDNIFITPGSFCVLAADSNVYIPVNSTLIVVKNFPSLNNNADHIQLLDFTGFTIDSLHYSSRWGGEADISLERINPFFSSRDSSNWTSSTAISGKTPGEINSVFMSVLPSDLSLSISPNPFSPDGNGHEDVTIIQYNLPLATAFVNVKVFDMMGRQVCELLNTSSSGSSREIIWNGKKNNGENLRIGVYILFLEALNVQLGVIKVVKKPIVIAAEL